MFILAFHLDAHQDKHNTSAQLSISALDAFLLRLEPAWTLNCAGLSACLAVLPLGNLTVPKSAFDLQCCLHAAYTPQQIRLEKATT